MIPVPVRSSPRRDKPSRLNILASCPFQTSTITNVPFRASLTSLPLKSFYLGILHFILRILGVGCLFVFIYPPWYVSIRGPLSSLRGGLTALSHTSVLSSSASPERQEGAFSSLPCVSQILIHASHLCIPLYSTLSELPNTTSFLPLTLSCREFIQFAKFLKVNFHVNTYYYFQGVIG